MKYEIVTALSYGALIFGYAVLAIKWLRGRKFFSLILPLVYLLFWIFTGVLLKSMSEGHLENGLTKFAGKIPLGVYIALFVAGVALCCLEISREHYIRKNTITAGSVREAVNSMECGLLYSDYSGRVVLMNRKMSELSDIFTVSKPINALELWQSIISFEKNSEARRIDFTSWPAFVLKGGSVWSFQRSLLTDADRRYVEIIARDVTDLYKKRMDTQTEIENLSLVHKKLGDVLENISETGNEEELLAYKVRIHDELGNAILRTRQVLRGGKTTENTSDNILEVWSNTIKAFKNNTLEAEKNMAGNLDSLYTQAKTLGIDLLMFGNFPEDNYVAVRAVREAMYNSIRHAYANTLTVETTHTKEGCYIRIYDDGNVKGDSITEGGGLKALRRAVEAEGGTMVVRVNRGVELNLYFREERHNDQSIDS